MMGSPSLQVVAWLLAAGIFVLDQRLGFPDDRAISLLYVGILLLALWEPRRRVVLWLAGGISALAGVSWILAVHRDPSVGLTNRLLALAVVWVTAIGIHMYRGTVDERRTVERHVHDLQRALDRSAILAITDVRGTITYVNDAFCRIAKFTRGELVGQDHRIVNSGLHPPEFFREMYRAIGGGEVWSGEIRNRAKDGTFYWVDTTIVPFLDNAGQPYQYVAIHFDSTARRQAELHQRDEAALAKLGRMATVVAHEVRNPLAGMRGALQVIDRRLAGAPDHPVVVEIIERIDGLTEIVQDLLEFARPRPPLLSHVPVADLLEEVRRLAAADHRFAGLKLQTDLEPLVLTADREQIAVALLSLIGNGVQAMGGRGTVQVTARTVDGRHELRVADQGPGLSPEARSHLFEPFFTTKHRGTGLGLATVRRTVQAHGGSIELTCPPGGGTVAVVTLPVEPAAHA